MKTSSRTMLLLALPLLAFGYAGCGDDEEPRSTLQITAHLDPDPPQVGRNTLHLSVLDATGAPVDGATVEVEPFMPSMGHGSSEDPVVTAMGDGQYMAEPVTFTMPGPWEVRIEATAGSEKGELVLERVVGAQ